jgi:hypothetical protein
MKEAWAVAQLTMALRFENANVPDGYNEELLRCIAWRVSRMCEPSWLPCYFLPLLGVDQASIDMFRHWMFCYNTYNLPRETYVLQLRHMWAVKPQSFCVLWRYLYFYDLYRSERRIPLTRQLAHQQWLAQRYVIGACEDIGPGPPPQSPLSLPLELEQQQQQQQQQQHQSSVRGSSSRRRRNDTDNIHTNSLYYWCQTCSHWAHATTPNDHLTHFCVDGNFVDPVEIMRDRAFSTFAWENNEIRPHNEGDIPIRLLGIFGAAPTAAMANGTGSTVAIHTINSRGTGTTRTSSATRAETTKPHASTTVQAYFDPSRPPGEEFRCLRHRSKYPAHLLNQSAAVPATPCTTQDQRLFKAAFHAQARLALEGMVGGVGKEGKSKRNNNNNKKKQQTKSGGGGGGRGRRKRKRTQQEDEETVAVARDGEKQAEDSDLANEDIDMKTPQEDNDNVIVSVSSTTTTTTTAATAAATTTLAPAPASASAPAPAAAATTTLRQLRNQCIVEEREACAKLAVDKQVRSDIIRHVFQLQCEYERQRMGSSAARARRCGQPLLAFDLRGCAVSLGGTLYVLCAICARLSIADPARFVPEYGYLCGRHGITARGFDPQTGNLIPSPDVISHVTTTPDRLIAPGHVRLLPVLCLTRLPQTRKIPLPWLASLGAASWDDLVRLTLQPSQRRLERLEHIVTSLATQRGWYLGTTDNLGRSYLLEAITGHPIGVPVLPHPDLQCDLCPPTDAYSHTILVDGGRRRLCLRHSMQDYDKGKCSRCRREVGPWEPLLSTNKQQQQQQQSVCYRCLPAARNAAKRTDKKIGGANNNKTKTPTITTTTTTGGDGGDNSLGSESGSNTAADSSADDAESLAPKRKRRKLQEKIAL